MILTDIYGYVVSDGTGGIILSKLHGIHTRMLQFLDTVKDNCMSKLQLLDTQDIFIERILMKVQSPNLVWLRWKDCPHPSLPSSISLKNLKVLHMRGFQLKTLWENESQAPLQLREDFKAPFSNIPKSTGKLKHLEWIAIGPTRYHMERNNLTNVPEEFGNLSNLQHIDLSHCSALERLPDSFGNLSNLHHINLSRCSALERLPDTFCKLINLKYLDLRHCTKLSMSSETIGNISTLKYIDLSFCSKIEVFPQQVAHQRSLEQLHLLGTNVKGLPSAIGELSYLEVLFVGIPLLDTLPPSLCVLSNLKELFLSERHGLKCLSPSLGDLKNLKKFRILGCKELKCLPASIGRLSQLTELSVPRCQLVGELPLQREVTGERETLSELESSILPRLQKLLIFKTGISEVSFAQGVCFNLRHLDIICSDNLVEVGTLPNTLTYLSFSRCHNLRKLDEIYGLAKLEKLDLGGCTGLEEFPRIETMVSLSCLIVTGCAKLKSILGLEQLAKLRDLVIGGHLVWDKIVHLGWCYVGHDNKSHEVAMSCVIARAMN